MTIMRFVRRLLGTDEEALAADERFRDNLKKMDTTQEELASAGASLDGILKDIAKKQEQLARSHSTSSGMSGQHRINIPPLPPLPELENDRNRKK